jgi:phage protein D
MRHESLHIEIDGREAADLYPYLVRVEVEEDDQLAAMFRLYLEIWLRPDGSWRHLEDERLAPWKRVTVAAGFESGREPLIDGYITHLRPVFDPDPSRCRLELWGMDASVLMDREEKLKAWPNKADSEIAAEVFDDYGLDPQVVDTVLVHDEAVSTIVQRETDIRFLRRLALRNGFDCYVEGTTGFFRPPPTDAAPQPVLAAHFGEETTITRLTLEVDALAPTSVAMAQVDRASKEVLAATAGTSRQAALGRDPAAAQLPDDIDPASVFVSGNVTTGSEEMAALCQGLFHRAEWFVTAEGEVAGNRYGHVLRPRGTVTVKGVGEAHSGVYYVCHVTHRFSPDGYVQSFRLKRNALRVAGSESFAPADGGLGGVGGGP